MMMIVIRKSKPNQHINIRPAHMCIMCVDITVHSHTQHSTELIIIPLSLQKHHSSDVVYWSEKGDKKFWSICRGCSGLELAEEEGQSTNPNLPGNSHYNNYKINVSVCVCVAYSVSTLSFI